MSYKVTSTNGKSNATNVKEFLCDSIADVALLPKFGIEGVLESLDDTVSNDPCAIGSTAFICETSDVYILSPSNEWVKL